MLEAEPQKTMEVTTDQALEIALNHYQQNELQQATEICRKILEVDTQNAFAYSPPEVSAIHLLGLISLRRNDFGVARKLVHTALQLTPKDSDTHNSFGLILEKLGLLRSSALWYQKASFLNPNDTSIMHNLANVLQSLDYHQEVEQLSQNAIRIDPNVANFQFQALSLDKTDISQDTFELQYQLALGNELAENGQHATAVSHYQKVLGKKEIIFFFSPDISVTPHFVAQCILGKTLQGLGYTVVFLLCRDLFHPFTCDEISDLTNWLDPSLTEAINEKQTKRAKIYLRDLSLVSIDLLSFQLPDMKVKIDALVAGAPENLLQLEMGDLAIGKIAACDLILLTKNYHLHDLSPDVRFCWQTYIKSGLLSYFLVDRVCNLFAAKSFLHFNSYTPMLCGRLAARKHKVPTFYLTQASHRNIDRRRHFITPGLWMQSHNNLRSVWPKWRDLALDEIQIRDIADDLICRFEAKGVHIYSPPKSLASINFYQLLNLSDQRHLLVLYTSSNDELSADGFTLEAIGDTSPLENITQTFGKFPDQIQWITEVIKLVETSSDLQLVVRIHPREAPNKRESKTSKYLSILKEHFDRPYDYCRFIWPDRSDISSYDLLEVADLVLTALSNVGIEATRCGIPVLTTIPDKFKNIPECMESALEPREYFSKLRSLPERTTKIDSILLAFRWYNLFQLGPTVNLGDVIPAHDFVGFPEFKMPSESKTVEKVIICQEDIVEINWNKQYKKQKGDNVHEVELISLKAQLKRILHFIFTGEDREGSYQLIASLSEGNGHIKDVNISPETSIVYLSGKDIRYIDNGKEYQRYSPMLSRIARMCGDRIIE